LGCTQIVKDRKLGVMTFKKKEVGLHSDCKNQGNGCKATKKSNKGKQRKRRKEKQKKRKNLSLEI